MDSKLQEVLLDYGLEGYGLYWYCLEMIVNKIEVDNLTFELEHDARIIARNTGSTPQKVSEMMARFVDLGLFQNNDGRITCLKLLQRLDKSMTSNPKFRDAISKSKDSHDTVMISPDSVMQDKKRLEKIREEENRKESNKLLEDAIAVEFEYFWINGLKNGVKKDAKKKFISIVKRGKLNAGEFAGMLVNDCIKRKSLNQIGFDKMHATTYLNKERWTDELPEPAQPRYTNQNKQEIDNDNTDWINTPTFSETLGD